MSSPLPRLVVRPPQHEVIAQMRDSLRRAQELYKRGGQIVRVICDDGDLPPGVMRPANAPSIRLVGRATLRSELSRCGYYCRLKKVLEDGTEIWEACHPPEWGVDGVFELGTWPLKPLEGIVEAPVILRSGEIITTPGYHAHSGLLFVPPAGASFLPVSEEPTTDEIQNARAWLHEAVCDFPFQKPEHRSAWMAGVLSYFARPAYSGQTPLFLVDGNVRGVGKGKLAGTAAHICVGREPMVQHQTSDEKSEKELITAVALSGETIVLLDNITYPLGSSSFDSVLTEGLWVPILKYQNDPSRFRLKAIWWGNGNNIQFRKQNDTVRRSLKIRIESPHEHPEQRTDIKRPEPLYGAWVKEKRPELVWAALTLLRGFIRAGAPSSGMQPWGSFEGWSQIVRGTLVWAGEPDPYKAAAVHDQTADTASEALGEFLRGWRHLCKDLGAESLTAMEAITELRCHIEHSKAESGRTNPHERLVGAICELAPPKHGRLPEHAALGYALRKWKGRVVAGMRLESIAGRDKLTAWMVV